MSKDTPPDVAADFAQIYRTLDGLSEKFRVVMIMGHVEGWQIDDIAVAMRSSRASVNRWLRDAEAASLRALNRGRPPALLGDKGRA